MFGEGAGGGFGGNAGGFIGRAGGFGRRWSRDSRCAEGIGGSLEGTEDF